MLLPPRARYAQLPTPIESLPKISEELGVDLRVKRDDLTGSWLTGNKVRKLEYLLPYAKNEGCNAVITIGAVNSNHCRATAILAAREGLQCHLILRGEKPAYPQGNYLLDRMAGVRTTFVNGPNPQQEVDEAIHEAKARFAREGSKAYLIPVGGSNEIGSVGYIEAVEEIKRDAENTGWMPDTIVVAVGSSGTFAGLCLGCWIHAPQVKVFGINICNTAQECTDRAYEDCRLANERFGLGLDFDRNSIFCQDGYVGEGYAKTTDEQLQYYGEVARKEALILDPVYTGKAFWGMVQEIKKGNLAPNSKILFIHTGGVFGLEAYGPRFETLLP